MAPKRKTYIKNCTGLDCEKEKKKAHDVFLRISFFLLTSIFFCLSLYMLFFSAEMEVTEIKITGTKELNDFQLQQEVESSLEGKFFGLLPKDNYLLVSRGRVEKMLAEKYKKIRSVRVEKRFPDTLTISIDERDSLLVWCKGENECFMLDEDGVAYNAADFNSPELTQNKLLTINDRSSSEVLIGSEVIKKSYEDYILKIKDELGKLGVETESNFYVPSRMAEEIEIRSIGGYSILLSSQFTLESAMKTLAIVLEKEIPKEKISQLEYIDLRSEYKAFYKYKNSPDSEQQNSDQQNSETENQKN